MTAQVIYPRQFNARITSASKPDFVKQQKSADVILMMTPDEPRYVETKLQILAAQYWGDKAKATS